MRVNLVIIRRTARGRVLAGRHGLHPHVVDTFGGWEESAVLWCSSRSWAQHWPGTRGRKVQEDKTLLAEAGHPLGQR